MAAGALRLASTLLGPSSLQKTIREAAGQFSIPERTLRTHCFLYLPRVTWGVRELTDELFEGEILRVAAIVRERLDASRSLAVPPPVPPELEKTSFDVISKPESLEVLRNCHYLASPRTDGVSLGLRWRTEGGDRLITLVTISPFDLRHVEPELPEDIAGEEVMVVSRVFAFDWAPKNAISFTLAKTVRAIRAAYPRVRMLLTYLNPNLGFTGASYRAANWNLFVRESGTRYSYVDHFYVTDRELVRLYGTADPLALSGKLGPRFETSRMPLEPLEIYAYAVDPTLRPTILALPVGTVERT